MILALQLTLAPALVGAATLAAWRYGPAVGGWLSSLPLIAGPVLLIHATEHGAQFAAAAANGTLLGLVALSCFLVLYARLAVAGHAPAVCLGSGWLVFFALTAALAPARVELLDSAALAAGALLLARRTMPAGPRRQAMAPEPLRSGSGLAARVLATGALVLLVSLAGAAAGPQVGGLLIAFPVLASLLAGFTHAQQGAGAVIGLLEGMASGLLGFAAFCAVLAATLASLGLALGFAGAVAAALATQGATLPLLRQRDGRQDCAHAEAAVRLGTQPAGSAPAGTRPA